MRSIKIIITLLLVTTTLAAQQNPSSSVGAPLQQPRLLNETDSMQYTLGAYLGQYIINQGLTITNPTLFLQGMDDALDNRELLVDADSVNYLMGRYLSKSVQERGATLEKELFTSLKTMEGVGSLPSGVYYMVAKNGTGKRPLATDTVTIHVKGYLPTGEVFEDSYTKNQPLTTTPLNLIPGMGDALQIMPTGSVWRLFIPSSQAYGQQGVQGLIPAYSAVIFDVELINIKEEKTTTTTVEPATNETRTTRNRQTTK